MNTTPIKETKIPMGDYVDGVALSCEEVANLKDKTFEIVLHTMRQFKDPRTNETKDKVVLGVKLANGIQVEYYPNPKVLKALTAIRGRDKNQWIGYKGEFITAPKDVFGVLKQVIYLKV